MQWLALIAVWRNNATSATTTLDDTHPDLNSVCLHTRSLKPMPMRRLVLASGLLLPCLASTSSAKPAVEVMPERSKVLSWSELAEARVKRIAATSCIDVTDDQIAARVKRIVVEHLGVDERKVTPNASFIEDLGADSLDSVELVMAFEESFGIEISEKAAESIRNVKDVTSFLAKSRCALRPSGATGQVRPQGDNEFAEPDQQPMPTAEARPPPTASRPGRPCGSLSGIVKWYNSTKGYGFIQPDGPGKDVFVHVAELQRSGLGKLSEKQVVRFNVATVRGLPAASDICVVQ